jgi:hypothetical protein
MFEKTCSIFKKQVKNTFKNKVQTFMHSSKWRLASTLKSKESGGHPFTECGEVDPPY